MRQSTASVSVRLLDPNDDPERIELATAALRAELLDLDVDDVVPARGLETPDNARGLDGAVIGSLLIMLPQIYESLRDLAVGVQRWLARDGGHYTAEMEINGDRLVVTGISSVTQQRLIKAWLQVHALDVVDEGE